MKAIGKSMGIAAGTGVLGLLILFYLVPFFFPAPAGVGSPPERGLVFADFQDRPLRRLLTEEGLRTDAQVEYSELSDSLIQATLAAEDSRFFSHNGVDVMSTVRAIRDGLIHRRPVSGASTISQQLVKISSPVQDRNLKTKFEEVMKARNLETFYSKEEILTSYLNRLPYGNQLTGCRSAARRYFGKPVSDLSLAESAFLAGIPNKPGRFNPFTNFEFAKQRQGWVLSRMRDEGMISADEFERAQAEELVLQPANATVFHAPHFIELIIERKREAVTEAARRPSRLRTSLDLELQDLVESLVARELNGLAREHGFPQSSNLQAAVVVIDNASGEVRALTGSRSFFGSESGQINGAWTPRSAGSTLKPFTYVLSLERGYTAGMILPDVPVEYVSSAGAYQPVNFDRRFNGPVTLRSALANSLNVPAVRVLKEIGGPRVLHRFLVRDLGMTSLERNPDEYGLGLTLGNAEARLLELTNAYACLARLGIWKPWRLFPTNPGEEPSGLEGKRLFSEASGWILADVLSDNTARAPSFGMNSALHLPFQVAAKTGTSTDFRDNWTIGFTPEHTVGVWVGRFDNRPLPNRLSGAFGAGPIFHEIMLALHEDNPASWYERPDGIEQREIDELNGLVINESLKNRPKKTRSEFFRTTHLPESAETSDYTKEGKTLLSRVYADWWEDSEHSLGRMAELRPPSDEDADDSKGLRIVSPLPGTVAYLDPDLPAGGQRFPLRIEEGNGSARISWRSSSLKIESVSGRHWVILKPGTHQVEAVDEATGARGVTTIQVEEL